MNMYESNSKKEIQDLHYKMLQDLQIMARDLPSRYQQRLPYDLLSALASSLLDGTVFDIVKSLREVQHLEEKSLSTQRLRMVNEHRAQRHKMEKKHMDLRLQNANKPHNLPMVDAQIKHEMETFKNRCDDELRRRDLRTMHELDRKVMDQQGLLEKAGVPGFFVTNDRHEIQLQMYLLQFVCSIAQNYQNVSEH